MLRSGREEILRNFYCILVCDDERSVKKVCNLLFWFDLLLTAVPPFITVHPESKIRMPGQSVTFCCEGQGNPPPEIEW